MYHSVTFLAAAAGEVRAGEMRRARESRTTCANAIQNASGGTWNEPNHESMEGAALHYVCLMEQVPFAQVRCISNYIEPRNRKAWDIPIAVGNLNEWLVGFVGKMI